MQRRCSINTIFPTTQIELCLEQKDLDSIKKRDLLEFSNLCWGTYSPRLSSISDEVLEKAQIEYFLTNSGIIDSILELGNPISLSLSVTPDGSIHYTFRFDNNSTLFIETFIHLEETNSTYIEFFQDGELIFQGNEMVNIGLERVKKEIAGFRNSKGHNFDMPFKNIGHSLIKDECDDC